MATLSTSGPMLWTEGEIDHRPPLIAVVGKTYSGKSCLGRELGERLGVTPINTGDLCRSAAFGQDDNASVLRSGLNRSELSQLRVAIESAGYVQDQTLAKLLSRRIMLGGLLPILLLGCPRTDRQTSSLTDSLRPIVSEVVMIYLAITDEEAHRRHGSNNRYLCSHCQAEFEILNADTNCYCRSCGGLLVPRQEDITRRLEVDAEHLQGVLHRANYLNWRVIVINGDQRSHEQVFQEAWERLNVRQIVSR